MYAWEIKFNKIVTVSVESPQHQGRHQLFNEIQFDHFLVF